MAFRPSEYRVLALLPLFLALACAESDEDGSPPSVALQGVPVFQGDLSWPSLDPTWILGPGTGVAVDSRDHVWLLHRPDPERLTAEMIAERQNPDIPGCCVPAPPLIEIDTNGNVVQAWGSIEPDSEWPQMPHGVFVDHNDFVWVASSIYHQVMKFTRDGGHLLTLGRYDQVGGSNDVETLGGSAGIYVDPETNELFVADGYANRRVIVFDAETGAYLRHWGAYGEAPDDTQGRRGGAGAQGAGGQNAGGQGAAEQPSMPPQFNLPHGIRGSNDGIIYVADRGNSRVQAFTREGEFLREARVRDGGTGAFDLALSHDPEQRYLYVADGGQHLIHILERSTLEVVGSFGGEGTGPGQFGRPHNMAADSDGNLYVAEADPGFRFQKLVFQNSGGAAGP